MNNTIFVNGAEVTIVGDAGVTIAPDAKLGKNVTLYTPNFIGSNVTIGNSATILPGNFITNTAISDGCKIGINNIISNSKLAKNVTVGSSNSLMQSSFSDAAKIGNNNNITKSNIGANADILDGNHITQSNINFSARVILSMVEESVVGENCTIGPYAHLRPNTLLSENVRVGNFCEIKNSSVGQNSKVSHLAYVGDATVGKNCNIGCGVIFANYNGKIKSKTYVADNCFIGSNCNLIAPLTLAKSTYVCAGTTVTQSSAENDFIIGRVRPTVKPNHPRP